MKPFPIPVTLLGPGAHEEGDTLDYLKMPADMDVFTPPRIPDASVVAAAPGALAVLRQLVDVLAAPLAGNQRIDVAQLPAADAQLLNQLLAEGEVSARITTVDGAEVRVQESVFAGVWRLVTTQGGRIVADVVEVGAVPRLFHEAAAQALWPQMPVWDGALPPGVVNAPALIEEVRAKAQQWQPGQAAHVVNLTLLPMSMQDIAFLDHHLGTGSLLVLSRGYGNCRISSTRLAHCWRVVYYNSADAVILNTVEITAMPEVAQAAPEDLRDAHERLADIVAMLQEDAA